MMLWIPTVFMDGTDMIENDSEGVFLECTSVMGNRKFVSNKLVPDYSSKFQICYFI